METVMHGVEVVGLPAILAVVGVVVVGGIVLAGFSIFVVGIGLFVAFAYHGKGQIVDVTQRIQRLPIDNSEIVLSNDTDFEDSLEDEDEI